MDGARTLTTAAVMAAAYGLGSILFGPIVARARGIDLRRVGSGNPGATNVERVLGRRDAAIVLALDAAKGAVAVLLARACLDERAAALAGLAAVVGHCVPLLAWRRGGKGVATALGAWLALHPWSAAAAIGTYLAARRASGYGSVGSLAAVGAGATTVLARTFDPTIAGATCATALLVLLRHRENLQRLRAGTEPRAGRGASASEAD